jgi:hypothetical protein
MFMTLQQLIHKAITDPQFRAALEGKAVNPSEMGCTHQQVQVAAIALRFNRRPAGQGQRALGDLLGNNVLAVPGWRGPTVQSLSSEAAAPAR